MLSQIENPSYVKTTGYFGIWTKRNNYIIDEITDAFNYSTIAGDINVTLTPNIFEAGK